MNLEQAEPQTTPHSPLLNNHGHSSDDDFNINVSSFYTILNEEDILYCSIRKPDEFLRGLLLKILKFSKSFLDTLNIKNKEDNIATQQMPVSSSAYQNPLINAQLRAKKRPFIDLFAAKEMYQSAEFRSLLSESKELQHLNLNALKSDNQKLSFFINLYNLMSIHSHFYLASKCSIESACDSEVAKSHESNSSSSVKTSQFLFRNKTEKLLFEQRMCYKVGQMGCISLYDLKHHILARRCLNNEVNLVNKVNIATPASVITFSDTSASQASGSTKSTPSKSKAKAASNPTGIGNNKSASKNNTASNGGKLGESAIQQTSAKTNRQTRDTQEELFKYAFYTLDLDSEPLWARYMPSDKVCDYRILFALTNCTESDPPICVYNSDDLLDDQLLMQMKLFLNESVFADLCYDTLYLPAFLIENCSFFLHNSSPDALLLNTSSSVLAKLTATAINTNLDKNDLDGLVRFLMDYVNDELKEGLKCLLDLDSIHGFGENIDQYGRKELPFPIEKIPSSTKFGLITDYNYSNDAGSSWYAIFD